MPIKGHVTPAETAKVREAIAYLEKNYTRDISLDHLVEEVHLDRKVFRMVFTELTGTTVHNYLIETRLKRAKEDLEDFSLTISQVAYRHGFLSGTTFTKLFRKVFGMVPTEYRIQLIEEGGEVTAGDLLKLRELKELNRRAI